MGEKLGIGSEFPALDLNLTDGSTLSLPGGLTTKFAAVLFYRGHW